MLNRSKFWAVSLLLTVFVSGVAVGGPVWNTIYDRGTPGGGRRGGPPESREHGRRSFAEHLQGDLNLSTAQRTAVDSILAESQDAMHEAWAVLRSQLDTLRQDVSDEIMQLLDDEQAETFREMIARSRRRGDREREPRENRYHE